MLFGKIKKHNLFKIKHFTNKSRFVECEHEFGFERWLDRRELHEVAINGKSNRIRNEFINNLGNLKDGVIPALHMLEAGYNEMKEHLDKSKQRNLLPITKIMKDVSEGIERIEEIFRAPKQSQQEESEKKKLLQNALDVPDVVQSADGEDDWKKRYESQDLPNIGERRFMIKQKSVAFECFNRASPLPTSSVGNTPVKLPPAESTTTASASKRKKKSKKDLAILYDEQQNEEAFR